MNKYNFFFFENKLNYRTDKLLILINCEFIYVKLFKILCFFIIIITLKENKQKYSHISIVCVYRCSKISNYDGDVHQLPSHFDDTHTNKKKVMIFYSC